MRQWFVATTKIDLMAAANLREQGYAVYLPKTYRRQLDSRKFEPVSALRFTGYVFIEFDAAAQEHGPINNTRGVDELLVSAAGDPIPLPPGIVEQLRQIEDEEFARAASRKKPKPRDDLVAGDLVRIDHREHPAHGQRGHLLGCVEGWASVLCGMVVWKVAEIDLRKIEPELRKAG